MREYVDENYYIEVYKGELIPGNELEEKLKLACRHIDILTYNRIVGRTFEKLTKFQQDIIQEVACKLADFEHENDDILQTPFSSYSINGVSMSFEKNWNVKIENGVAIPKDYYCLLQQTGLTCQNGRF